MAFAVRESHWRDDGTTLRNADADDAATATPITIDGNLRATAVNDDEANIDLALTDSAGSQVPFARMKWVGSDIGDLTLDGRVEMYAAEGGSIKKWLEIGVVSGTMSGVRVPLGEFQVWSDSNPVSVGAAGDASLDYDGTDLQINPQVVGSGDTVFSAGNVGIGATPSLKLHITNSAASGEPTWVPGADAVLIEGGEFALCQFLTSAGAGDQAGILFSTPLVRNDGYIVYDYTSQDVLIKSANIQVLADNQKILLGAGQDASITYDATNLVFNSMEVGTGFYQFLHAEDAVSNKVAEFQGNTRATALDNDEAYISLMLDDDGGLSTEYGRITWVAEDVTDLTEDGAIVFDTMQGGVLTEAVKIDGDQVTITNVASSAAGRALIIDKEGGSLGTIWFGGSKAAALRDWSFRVQSSVAESYYYGQNWKLGTVTAHDLEFHTNDTLAVYVDGTTQNLVIPADNRKILIGAADDASIAYDATNLVINPKEVGVGVLSVLGDISLLDEDIILGTTTGTKIGTATTQKIGFWNTTPAVQPVHIADADGTLADITTKFNTLLAQLATIGLQAAS